MGTVTRRGRNSDGFIFGILYTSSLPVLPDSGLSPNDFFGRKQIWKEADLLFTVPMGIPFWDLGEHEPMIITLLITII